MKSSHRKTFTKLKKQNSLLRNTKDQINSETYQVWLNSKKRLLASITNSVGVKHEIITDFFDLKFNKVHSPNIGLKSRRHNMNHRKQLKNLFNSKDWQDCFKMALHTNIEMKSNMPSAYNQTIKDKNTFLDQDRKYKLSVQRTWQNNATITKKDF